VMTMKWRRRMSCIERVRM